MTRRFFIVEKKLHPCKNVICGDDSTVPLGRMEFIIRLQAVNDLSTVSRPYRAKKHRQPACR
jgi:hypothetical protein